MNQNRKNATAQTDPRQQMRACRAAAAAAGYTTYEGGDFRPAHRVYEARPNQAGLTAVERAGRAAQVAESRDVRVPRGERGPQAPAAAREALELREERVQRNAGNGGAGNGHHGRRGSGSSNGRSPKPKRGPAKPLIAALAIALLLGGFGLYKVGNLTPDEATGGAFYDQSAAQIQEAVDHEVEDGYFNMSINTSVPVFEDSTAALGVKNIESNSYDCTVTVTLDDGREVYKSGGLAPGTELDMVTLTQQLEPGDYEATATFDIYEQDEAHTVAGQTASKLTLHVL